VTAVGTKAAPAAAGTVLVVSIEAVLAAAGAAVLAMPMSASPEKVMLGHLAGMTMAGLVFL